MQNRYRKTAMWLVAAWLIGGVVTTAAAAPSVGQPEVPPSIGQPAPEFDLTLFSGQKVALKDFRGKSVVINFWHSMCVHCQGEAPALEATYERYRKSGLVIIGINIADDDEGSARAFVERYKLSFPVGHDTKGEIGSLYRVQGTDTMIFVDRAGRLADRHEGELTEAEFGQRIEELLK